MDQIKISHLFKTLIFLILIITITGFKTQNFSTKACMFFSVAVTFAFTFEFDFIYEPCEGVKLKIKRNIKEIIMWTIIGLGSFLAWLTTFEALSDLAIEDEYKAAITFVIWIFVYRLIKASFEKIIDASNWIFFRCKSFPNYDVYIQSCNYNNY